MPRYQITTPDGQHYEVTAPDGASQADVLAYAQQHHAQMQAPAASSPDPLDIPKSAAGGVATGIAGMADLPEALNPAGMLRMFANQFLPDKQKIPSPSAQLLDLFQRHVTPIHQPQTTAGEYARTIGEFTPAAIAGPEGIVPKIASVVVPGVASETAGQVTKGTPYEGIARLLGGLAGGGLSGVRTAPKVADVVPSTEDLFSAAGKAYDRSEQAGAIVSNDALKNAVNDLQSKLAEKGLEPTLHPNSFAAFNSLKTAADNGLPITLKGLDLQRQIASDAIGNAIKGGKDGDAMRGGMIKGSIDDLVDNLKPHDLVGSQDPQAAVDALNEARPLWAKASKAEDIQDLIDRANIRAGQYTQAGPENALRVEFRSLAMNKNKMRRFTPDEQDAIKSVAQGGPASNALRLLGKFAPKGVVSLSAGVGTGFLTGGPMGAAALPIAGEAAHMLSTALTKGRANQALQTMQRGGPAPTQPMLTYQNPYPPLLSLLRGGTP